MKSTTQKLRRMVRWIVGLAIATQTLGCATQTVQERRHHVGLYSKHKGEVESLLVSRDLTTNHHRAMITVSEPLPSQFRTFGRALDPIYLEEKLVSEKEMRLGQLQFDLQQSLDKSDPRIMDGWRVSHEGRGAEGWMLFRGGYSAWKEVKGVGSNYAEEVLMVESIPISCYQKSSLRIGWYVAQQAVLYPLAFCFDVVTFPVQAALAVLAASAISE